MVKIKTFFRYSLTILWARMVGVAGLLLALSDPLLDLLAAPGIKDQIQSILDPKFVPFYVIAIAVVTELARRRSLPAARETEGV